MTTNRSKFSLLPLSKSIIGLAIRKRSTAGSLNDRTNAVPRTKMDYLDVGLFFFYVSMLALAFRTAGHFGMMARRAVETPPLGLQVAVSVCLLGLLGLTIKIRHGYGAWEALGWTMPDRPHLLTALAGGVLLGIGVDVLAHTTRGGAHIIRARDLFVLGVSLGPILEESYFRGCLLPVLSRTTGPLAGLLVSAVIFATMHPVTSVVQWCCFIVSGVAYGWIRLKSGSTAASALMHAIYNLTLFFCQFT